jgi:hypothetical protein
MFLSSFLCCPWFISIYLNVFMLEEASLVESDRQLVCGHVGPQFDSLFRCGIRKL